MTSQRISAERRAEILATMRKAHLLHRDENRIGLTNFYTLEGLDPQHRDKVQLNTYFAEWKKTPQTQKTQNFFTWVNSTYPEFAKKQGVIYLESSERIKYQISVNSQGVIRRGTETEPYDTTAYGGKSPGMAAYVIDTKGNLYIGEHKSHVMHHSSFLAGALVMSAGMIKIEEGKITHIDHKSGHYIPTKRHLENALKVIPKEAFGDKAVIEFSTSKSVVADFFLNIRNNFLFKWLPNLVLEKLVQFGNSLLSKSRKTEVHSSSDYYSQQRSMKDTLIEARETNTAEAKKEDKQEEKRKKTPTCNMG